MFDRTSKKDHSFVKAMTDRLYESREDRLREKKGK